MLSCQLRSSLQEELRRGQAQQFEEQGCGQRNDSMRSPLNNISSFQHTAPTAGTCATPAQAFAAQPSQPQPSAGYTPLYMHAVDKGASGAPDKWTTPDSHGHPFSFEERKPPAPITFVAKPSQPLELPDGFTPLDLPDNTSVPMLGHTTSEMQPEPLGAHSRPWQDSATSYTSSSQLAATLQSLGIQIADGEHVQLEAMLADLHLGAGPQYSS